MGSNKVNLLTAKEIKELLGYSRESLIRWEAEGKLEGAITRTPGGQRRYKLVELEAQLALQTNTTEEGIKRPSYTELGETGVRNWHSSVYSERLKELKGKKGKLLLREIRMNDPVIAAMFFGIGNAIKQATMRIQSASQKSDDVKCANFIESCFEDMSWSWSDQFTFVYDPTLEQGFSVLEVVYKKRLGRNPALYIDNPAESQYNDGMIGWRKWAPRPAESLVEGDEWIFDQSGGIKGIKQEIEFGKVRQIPIRKLLHFRTTVHPANNPEGVAIHRGAYLSWWNSMNIQELEGIGIERDLAGIPIVYLGSGTTISGPYSDFTMAKDLVVNLRQDEQAGIVIPHPKMTNDGKGMLVELLSSNSRRQYNTNDIINRYDKRKAMTTLAQFLMLGMEQGGGSYALARQQGDLFVLAITAWLQNFADIINRHAIPKLVEFNESSFLGITGFPKYIPGVVGIPDLEGLSNFVNRLVEKEVITPDPELERALRQTAGLPLAALNQKQTAI